MEVHYNPEQAAKAHQAVRGKLVVPSGWGAFDLGLFPWHEPIERFLVAADKASIVYLTPKIGEVIYPLRVRDNKLWWKPFIRIKGAEPFNTQNYR